MSGYGVPNRNKNAEYGQKDDRHPRPGWHFTSPARAFPSIDGHKPRAPVVRAPLYQRVLEVVLRFERVLPERLDSAANLDAPRG